MLFSLPRFITTHHPLVAIRAAFTLFFLCVVSPLAWSAGPHSPLGINSNEIMEDDASVPFVDIFKSSLPFIEARPWLTKGHIRYDRDGWPTYIPPQGQVGTRFIKDMPARVLPEGLYTVLYQGKGTLLYGHNARLVKRLAGKDIISIRAGNKPQINATLIIKATDPKNPIRNIHILMPGGICSNNPFRHIRNLHQCQRGKFLSFEKHFNTIVFNPAYLAYMQDFKVIRFMNMSGITRNPITAWSQRNRLSQQTWGGKTGIRGAPLEIMVMLANILNIDPWFCLPHKANNDYIQRFARYVRHNLNAPLKVYIEYTNEAWNGIFTQANYVKHRGLAMRLDKDKIKAGYKYYSLRSVQIFDLWERVFGGKQRLVRVMGGYTPYARLSEMVLSYRNAYKKTDVLAIAPYFYPQMRTARQARSINDIFKALYDPKEPYSIPNVIKLIHKQAKTARKYGVQLVAYEGGQHLVDWDSRNVRQNPTRLFIAVNRNQRMAKAYFDLLSGWKKAGGTLFVAFSAPRTPRWFGSWGTKEYINQPIHQAPKHRALVSFARRNPCWWRACNSQYIARLKKPIENPGNGIFALVSNTAVGKSVQQRRNSNLLKTETKRRQAAQKRIENTMKQEMIRRSQARQKIETIRKREAARIKAFKQDRLNKIKQQRLQARLRRQLRRNKEARRR
jgi:hypothetical protein